jgi:cytochrome c oxidase subunit 3
VSIILTFLVLLMGAVAWWLVKQTVNVKPWASEAAGGGDVRDEGVRSPMTLLPLPSVKLGLGVFLAVVTSLFALFISAYSIRMEYQDWRPLAEPAALWINTGVLVLSSVFLQLAWNAARRGDISALRRNIVGGAVFAITFVAGQLLIWNQLSDAGFLVSSNPANAFFYLLTGMHALHLLGGLVALARSIKRVWADVAEPAKIRLGVELCTVYWHYLLAVWLVLFSLLLST